MLHDLAQPFVKALGRRITWFCNGEHFAIKPRTGNDGKHPTYHRAAFYQSTPNVKCSPVPKLPIGLRGPRTSV